MPPVRRAVRRAGATRRARPRPGRGSAGAVRRRADGRAPQPDRRAGDGAARPRRARPGHHGRPRHTRAAGGRLRRPRGRRTGRADHLGRGGPVIRFALRLTFAGGREAAARLLITAAAVALGVGLLLAALAGINAVNAQTARYAWQNSGVTAATEAHAVTST